MVPADGVVAFLHPLPVGALWGVGEKTERGADPAGPAHGRRHRPHPARTLQRALGEAAGAHLHALAWGRDDRPVVPHEPDKSIGAEETFAADVDDPEVVRRELLRLSERTAARPARGRAGRPTVAIKLRFADFTTITRARTLREPTDLAREIYATARALYEASGLDAGPAAAGRRPGRGTWSRRRGRPVSSPSDDAGTGWREAERAMDQARTGSARARSAPPRSSRVPTVTRRDGRDGTRERRL